MDDFFFPDGDQGLEDRSESTLTIEVRKFHSQSENLAVNPLLNNVVWSSILILRQMDPWLCSFIGSRLAGKIWLGSIPE